MISQAELESKALMPAVAPASSAETMMIDQRLYELIRARSPEAAAEYLVYTEAFQAEVERMLRKYGLIRITEFLVGPEGGARLRQLTKPVCPLCAVNLIYSGERTRDWVCPNCQFMLKDDYLGRFRGTRRNGPFTQNVPSLRVWNPDMKVETLEIVKRARTITFDEEADCVDE